MFVLVLNLDAEAFCLHSNDSKDFLEIIKDECSIPKSVYDEIEKFVYRAKLGDVCYLKNNWGRICAVDVDDLYRRYQLNWMIEHGYSINDLISSLYDYSKEFNNHPVSLSNSIRYIFNQWELEDGFNGEIWVCREEWEDYELYEVCFK